ncbi:MAG: hypothetical protein ABSH44_18485 [Bryobacteraceae bacterium]|jgi:hypothetical protein
MPERTVIKLRRLPDGDYREGVEIGWKGRVLEVDLPSQEGGFPPGTPLEIDCGSMLYLGELQQGSGSTARILVEHSVDRAKLDSIQDAWE